VELQSRMLALALQKQEVARMIGCPKCGRLMARDKFCEFCGFGYKEYIRKILEKKSC
jgi:ribosomal protein L37E